MQDNLLRSSPRPGLVLLTLNRPTLHNALDAALIGALHETLRALAQDASCRVVMLTGAGKSFCAGADLNAMLALGQGPLDENRADADALAQLLFTLHSLPKPTLAVINGTTMGGGAGIAAACDIAFASSAARFRFPEVLLGIVPAVISPYVCAAIGARQARRLFLSGEWFDAAAAQELGLVHRTAPAEELLNQALQLAGSLLEAAPQASAAVKRLLAQVSTAAPGLELGRWTAGLLAELRAGEEAQHGLAAALNRQSPRWKP